jgi:copper chaperone CopZ
MSRVTLQIDGMSCGHCLNAVNRALHGVSGATVAEVTMGRAVVDLPAGGPDAAALVAAVAAAGYQATPVVDQAG